MSARHDVPAAKTYIGRRGPGGTIRRRVIRTLALPVAAVLVLLGVITVIEVDDYRTADASASAVTLVLSVQELVQELQNERGLTTGLLGGNAGFRAELAPARERVDYQRAAVEKLVTGGGTVPRRVASAVRQLDGLAGVRAGIDTGAAARAPTFTFYTGRIAELSHIDFGLDRSTDPALRRGATALLALSDAKESTAQERAFLNGVFSAGGFHNGEFLQFVTMRSAKDAALASFTRYATGTQRVAQDYVFGTGAAQVAAYFERLALGAGDGRNLQVNPQSWWSALTTVLDDLLRLEQHVGSVIRARAATLQDQAGRRMGLLLGAVLLCFAGSVYLAAVASRSIARPLAVLADEANRLAGDRLPDAVRKATGGHDDGPPPPVPVPPGASDEVRLVADALDRVQATAYSLATGQARLRRGTTESLANLGRRNQNLLRRQLGFITRLELEESDPTGLANLFELDHLATRMRRNAESLLVLVGAASPRQWAKPLPVADVVRAAVSEVEEYRRVSLRRVDDTAIAGAVVSGVAHMLAELVENGLAFSPPDTDVEIQGRRLGDGYLIAITDSGVGMIAADLERANQRLRGEGDFITAPARFLGHYVVGRLAAEMAVDVQLAPSPVTGVTARIILPAAMLAQPEPVAGPAAAPPGHAAARPGHATRPARELEASGPVEPAPARAAPNAAAPNAPAPHPAAPAQRSPGPVERILPGTIEYVTVPAATPPVTVRPADPPARFERYATADVAGDEHDAYLWTPDETAEHTPNGLRKRIPGARKPATAGAASPPGAAPTRTADRPAPISDSPDEVRARLTALRKGLRRGSAEPVDRP